MHLWMYFRNLCRREHFGLRVYCVWSRRTTTYSNPYKQRSTGNHCSLYSHGITVGLRMGPTKWNLGLTTRLSASGFEPRTSTSPSRRPTDLSNLTSPPPPPPAWCVQFPGCSILLGSLVNQLNGCVLFKRQVFKIILP